jgi:hypothetical protein
LEAEGGEEESAEEEANSFEGVFGSGKDGNPFEEAGLVRSLAMPERAWVPMMKVMVETRDQAGLRRERRKRERIWRERPEVRVILRPFEEASQPPKRLVRMPQNS